MHLCKWQRHPLFETAANLLCLRPDLLADIELCLCLVIQEGAQESVGERKRERYQQV